MQSLIKIETMKFLILVPILLLISGCAAVSDGTIDGSKTILVTSDPSGAEVTIKGVPYGTTPCRITINKFDRGSDISFHRNGFKKINAKLQRQGNSWVLGNIIAGGAVGIGFDVLSGNGAVTKNTLHVFLTKE